jgi:hypothetical protein
MSAREFGFIRFPYWFAAGGQWSIVGSKNAVFVFFVLLKNIFHALPESILKKFANSLLQVFSGRFLSFARIDFK